jgi:predicted transcriptional regulator
VGLFTNPFLLFIAFFVYIGAAQESSMVQMKSALGGIPVERAMLTKFETLSPRDPLGRATQLILEGFQQDFPVVQNDQVIGLLMRNDLMKTLSQRGQLVPVAEVMRRDFITVEMCEMLETVFGRLQENAVHTVPVYDAGKLVGLLTMDNLGEFLMIQSALDMRRVLNSRMA